MITLDDVKKLNQKEVGKKILELKKELLSFKIQSSVSGAEKPHRKQAIKKDIARILTFSKQLNK
ncbi:MAG: 50S ribosomal protein L29 [Bacteriovorax sp.]|jgi:large subunit ribosomal protein L29|nr:50S ribosomal protein L29 [Bacteriovorax sp.]